MKPLIKQRFLSFYVLGRMVEADDKWGYVWGYMKAQLGVF